MTTIFKSNQAYGGASSLTNVSVLTKTGADIYADYAARVAADGGTVSDATECQAAIQAALDGDYYWRLAAAVSPRWGRKVSGANITKLYSIKGTIDAIMTGTVALDTTTVAGEQLAEMQVGESMSLTGLNVLADGADGLAVLSLIYGAAGATGQTAFTPVAQAWQVNHAVSANNEFYINSVLKFGSNPEYQGASLVAACAMAEMSTQRMTGFSDGVLRKVVSPSGGFTSLVVGATATVTYSRIAGTVYLGEWWFFNDVSGLTGQDAMIQAGLDVGNRY